MQTIWDRIEAWLKINAPEMMKHLLPGVTEQDIRKAEAILDVELPEEVKASYRIHNGSDGYQFIDLWQLNSLEYMLGSWEMWRDIVAYDLNGVVKRADGFFVWPSRPQVVWWHPRWIPFMEDINGDALCIDLAPIPQGQLGQIITFYYENNDPSHMVAPGFQSLLSTFANDLEAGKFVFDSRSRGLKIKNEFEQECLESYM